MSSYTPLFLPVRASTAYVQDYQAFYDDMQKLRTVLQQIREGCIAIQNGQGFKHAQGQLAEALMRRRISNIEQLEMFTNRIISNLFVNRGVVQSQSFSLFQGVARIQFQSVILQLTQTEQSPDSTFNQFSQLSDYIRAIMYKASMWHETSELTRELANLSRTFESVGQSSRLMPVQFAQQFLMVQQRVIRALNNDEVIFLTDWQAMFTAPQQIISQSVPQQSQQQFPVQEVQAQKQSNQYADNEYKQEEEKEEEKKEYEQDTKQFEHVFQNVEDQEEEEIQQQSVIDYLDQPNQEEEQLPQQMQIDDDEEQKLNDSFNVPENIVIENESNGAIDGGEDQALIQETQIRTRYIIRNINNLFESGQQIQMDIQHYVNFSLFAIQHGNALSLLILQGSIDQIRNQPLNSLIPYLKQIEQDGDEAHFIIRIPTLMQEFQQNYPGLHLNADQVLRVMDFNRDDYIINMYLNPRAPPGTNWGDALTLNSIQGDFQLNAQYVQPQQRQIRHPFAQNDNIHLDEIGQPVGEAGSVNQSYSQREQIQQRQNVEDMAKSMSQLAKQIKPSQLRIMRQLHNINPQINQVQLNHVTRIMQQLGNRQFQQLIANVPPVRQQQFRLVQNMIQRQHRRQGRHQVGIIVPRKVSATSQIRISAKKRQAAKKGDDDGDDDDGDDSDDSDRGGGGGGGGPRNNRGRRPIRRPPGGFWYKLRQILYAFLQSLIYTTMLGVAIGMGAMITQTQNRKKREQKLKRQMAEVQVPHPKYSRYQHAPGLPQQGDYLLSVIEILAQATDDIPEKIQQFLRGLESDPDTINEYIDNEQSKESIQRSYSFLQQLYEKMQKKTDDHTDFWVSFKKLEGLEQQAVMDLLLANSGFAFSMNDIVQGLTRLGDSAENTLDSNAILQKCIDYRMSPNGVQWDQLNQTSLNSQHTVINLLQEYVAKIGLTSKSQEELWQKHVSKQIHVTDHQMHPQMRRLAETGTNEIMTAILANQFSSMEASFDLYLKQIYSSLRLQQDNSGENQFSIKDLMSSVHHMYDTLSASTHPQIQDYFFDSVSDVLDHVLGDTEKDNLSLFDKYVLTKFLETPHEDEQTQSMIREYINLIELKEFEVYDVFKPLINESSIENEPLANEWLKSIDERLFREYALRDYVAFLNGRLPKDPLTTTFVQIDPYTRTTRSVQLKTTDKDYDFLFSYRKKQYAQDSTMVSVYHDPITISNFPDFLEWNSDLQSELLENKKFEFDLFIRQKYHDRQDFQAYKLHKHMGILDQSFEEFDQALA